MITLTPANDAATVARITGPAVMDPARWINHPNAFTIVAHVDGDPAAVAVLIDGPLPEVHIAVVPHHRGRTTFAIAAAMREWFMSTFAGNNLWTWSNDPREVRFARRLGFHLAFTAHGRTHLFHPLH